MPSQQKAGQRENADALVNLNNMGTFKRFKLTVLVEPQQNDYATWTISSCKSRVAKKNPDSQSQENGIRLSQV
jgi:hypothetical protein